MWRELSRGLPPAPRSRGRGPQPSESCQVLRTAPVRPPSRPDPPFALKTPLAAVEGQTPDPAWTQHMTEDRRAGRPRPRRKAEPSALAIEGNVRGVTQGMCTQRRSGHGLGAGAQVR